MATTRLPGQLIRSGSIPPAALGGGVISASAQLATSLPTGTVSSSVQVTSLLPTGILSSSTQFNALSGTSASFAPTILPAGIVSSSLQINTGVFTKTIVTSSLVSPYVITIADIGKRLQVDAATSGAIDLATSASTFATGDTLQVAAYGAVCSLYTDFKLDLAYNLNLTASSAVNITIQSDGKAIVLGSFTGVGPTPRSRIARINTDGTLDATYNPSASATPFSIAIQSDGKAIIGGNFTNVSGSTRNRIARINTDGTLDLTYDPDADSNVNAIAMQSDGKAIIVGLFTTIGGVTYNRIARINTNGTADATYNPNANGTVRSVAIQSDGKAIIVGDFTTVSGSSRVGIARINTNGVVDLTYDSGGGALYSTIVTDVALQSDDKAIIVGQFSVISGSSLYGVARMTTNGTRDVTYNPPTNNGSTLYSVAIQSDGKAIIGGSFNTVSGSTRNNIARINTDGTLDIGYNPIANDYVFDIAIQSDGNAIIGGNFTTMSGQPRNRIARINAEGSFVTLRAPYTLPTVQVPRYAVLTLEKAPATVISSSGEWWVINSNAS